MCIYVVKLWQHPADYLSVPHLGEPQLDSDYNVHMYARSHAYVRMRTCMCVHTLVCVCICMSILSLHLADNLSVLYLGERQLDLAYSMYTCMCVYICVCMCIYIYMRTYYGNTGRLPP